MNILEQIKKNIGLFAIMSLTLGLAPFTPEPHVWGKLKWLMGGGAFSGDHPMGVMDWFDFLMHGLPWLLFLVSLILKGVDVVKNSKQ
jgi:hypothetical protein